LVIQAIGTVVLSDDGAQAPKHVEDTHQMCVRNRQRALHSVGIKKVSGDTTIGSLNAIMLVTERRKSKDKLNKYGNALTMSI
jgi:hypothetical protein